MRKKKLALLLTGTILAVALTACGGNTTTTADADTSADTQATQEDQTEAEETTTENEFKIGETWTVDGLWSVTVDGVTETQTRNEFEEKEPAAVYIVDYTYTNIGFEDETGLMDGLYISLDDSITDSAGMMGYTYPGDVNYYPQEAPIGSSCKAQVCIGVDNAGSFKLNYAQYDADGNKHAATFLVDIG